jgi:hypothetical protein
MKNITGFGIIFQEVTIYGPNHWYQWVQDRIIRHMQETHLQFYLQIWMEGILECGIDSRSSQQ